MQNAFSLSSFSFRYLLFLFFLALLFSFLLFLFANVFFFFSEEKEKVIGLSGTCTHRLPDANRTLWLSELSARKYCWSQIMSFTKLTCFIMAQRIQSPAKTFFGLRFFLVWPDYF